MTLLSEKVIEFLNAFRLVEYHFRNESELQTILLESLKELLKGTKVIVTKQSRNPRERALIPDISIGQNQVLIEIKYVQSLNDIYRMFYQAVKYSKFAKENLIFFIYDPNSLLDYKDKDDLKMSDKVIIIHKR